MVGSKTFGIFKTQKQVVDIQVRHNNVSQSDEMSLESHVATYCLKKLYSYTQIFIHQNISKPGWWI